MNTQTELAHPFGGMREPIRVINRFFLNLPQAPQPYRQKAVRIVQERSHFFCLLFHFHFSIRLTPGYGLDLSPA